MKKYLCLLIILLFSCNNNENKINEVKIKTFTEKEKEIEDILNEYIKPAVEADGGAITLNYYKKNIV